jgi:hypothetical protein
MSGGDGREVSRGVSVLHDHLDKMKWKIALCGINGGYGYNHMKSIFLSALTQNDNVVVNTTESEQLSATHASQETYTLDKTNIGVVTNVLDVKDDTPLVTSPSQNHMPSLHNRSIVVLTPTQAIKFTALTRERHISWLTALSFCVHNDPADLIIPRGLSPNNSSLWSNAPSNTGSSIASSQGTQQFGTYVVRQHSFPDFAPNVPESPLGYKQRVEDAYATPPSVPRIPTGRRFDTRERSGSASGSKDWEDPTGRETIRMDAFVRRTPPRLEVDIDDNLFREF